jgi:tripartite-type tricarboxylate transporter receptor subunit TctC
MSFGAQLKRICMFVAFIAVAVIAPSLPVYGEYPDKPVRMLVGFAPGGGTDTTARIVSQRLATALGQQVIVDNRAGAGGNIAAEFVSHAPADGYTLLLGTPAAFAINPSLYRNLPFDPVKDFEPISLITSSSNVLVVHPSVSVKNVKELIAFAKARPGQLNYGSAGTGTPPHLAAVLFDTMAGTRMEHVPYKGGAPAMIALVSGEVELVFATVETAAPQIKAGKIRALGVTTAKRSALLPELPTIAEAGIPGYEANNWNGVLAPAKTPIAVVERLNREIVKVLIAQEVKEALFRQGFDAWPGTPQEFGAYIKTEIAKWAKVVKASGMKTE